MSIRNASIASTCAVDGKRGASPRRAVAHVLAVRTSIEPEPSTFNARASVTNRQGRATGRSGRATYAVAVSVSLAGDALVRFAARRRWIGTVGIARALDALVSCTTIVRATDLTIGAMFVVDALDAAIVAACEKQASVEPVPQERAIVVV